MSLLDWRQQWNLPSALKQTIDWYRAFYWHEEGPELRALCEQHIERYEAGECRANSSTSITAKPRPSEISRATFVEARPEAP